MNATTAELFRRAVGERRHTALSLTAGAVAMCALALAMYPSLRGQLGALTAALPPQLLAFFGSDMITPAGYVSSQVFTKIAPLLVMITAIGAGALPWAFERSGVLAVSLAGPVRRSQVLTAHALALLTEVLLVAGAVGVVLVALREPTGLDIPVSRLLAGTVALALLGVLHGLLTLAVGAATGSTGLALSVGTGVALGGFLLHGLAPLVETDLLGLLSPFHWAFGAQPLEVGWTGEVLLGLLALAGGSLLLLATAVTTFQRRDIG